jgi:nucleotide-binding universal stress UspA family protein
MVTGVFERIVCGVDGSESATAGVHIAAMLAEPESKLELVSVEDPSVAVHAGWAATAVANEIRRDAGAALERAREEAVALHAAEAKLLEGHPADRLLDEIRRTGATLAVVGSRGHSRAVGIALGSVTTMLVHEAPCSVLVARELADPGSWPRRIVVGLNGSAEAKRARAVGAELGDRFSAHVDEIVDAREPVAELSEASEDADLVVVGSRGLRGVRALGSVSERVAHEARCPVLIVRPRG